MTFTFHGVITFKFSSRGIHGREEQTKCWQEKLQIDLEDQNLEKRIILKRCFSKWDGSIWIGFMWLGIGTSGGHNNKPSGFIQCEEFRNYVSNNKLFTKESVLWSLLHN